MVNVEHKTIVDKSIILDRDAYIISAASNSSVIHLGCVDSGFTEGRYLDGSLLHLKLEDVCSVLYGIDIDCESVNYLRSKGIKEVYCYDIVNEDAENHGCSFIRESVIDYIVVGEVLEHLSDPGMFIKNVAGLAKRYQSRVIFTVPNAFALFRFKKLIKGIEHVHEDHVRYYSPRTVQFALEREGFEIKKVLGYIRVNDSSKLKQIMKKFLYFLIGPSRGNFSDGLIVIANVNK